MTTPAPPTTAIGRPDLGLGTWGQGLLSDWWETAADLIWPQSIVTYGRMRHDPKLRAVVQALTLPILRATWVVDPAGARDQVTQRVADDLGLPILGDDEHPGGARRRGVVWGRHLRDAANSLIYGHMPLERTYDVTGDEARLDMLGPRMPWTIASINLDPVTSNVASITQNTQREPIPANRLVWYAYGQEGANWAGISLLRPAFGAWLLKHEVWRVHATSIRRFGMGVPTVKAPAGATAAQVADAAAMAAGMRVGDQSGAGLPNGFTFELAGLTGSVPDALGLMSYLDQQMAGMALAGVLELGQTETGSRALGESFLDLFLLADQAIADDLALVANSGWPGMPGIVTDLVDVNWGPDEPCPAIRCLDLGESYAITAEALTLLAQYGLLSPDANIDDWIRRRWGLPAREGIWRPTSRGLPAPGQPGGALLPAGALPTPEADETPLADDDTPSDLVPSWTPPEAPAPQAVPPEGGDVSQGAPGSTSRPGAPAAAASRRGRRTAAAAPRRQLTATEMASGWSPEQHTDDWRSRLDGLLAAWHPVFIAQRDALVDQVEAAAARPDRLAGLTVDSAAGAAMLADAMQALAETAADRMVGEAAAQGVTISRAKVKIDAARLTASAQGRAALAGSYMCQAVANKAMQVSAAAEGDTPGHIIEVFIDGLSQMSLREQLAAALTQAQNQGRVAVLQAAPASAGKTVAYTASEYLDENTCEPCIHEDGQVFDSLTAAEAAYVNGGYIGCLGGLRCRGTVVANWGGVTRVS